MPPSLAPPFPHPTPRKLYNRKHPPTPTPPAHLASALPAPRSRAACRASARRSSTAAAPARCSRAPPPPPAPTEPRGSCRQTPPAPGAQRGSKGKRREGAWCLHANRRVHANASGVYDESQSKQVFTRSIVPGCAMQHERIMVECQRPCQPCSIGGVHRHSEGRRRGLQSSPTYNNNDNPQPAAVSTAAVSDAAVSNAAIRQAHGMTTRTPRQGSPKDRAAGGGLGCPTESAGDRPPCTTALPLPPPPPPGFPPPPPRACSSACTAAAATRQWRRRRGRWRRSRR